MPASFLSHLSSPLRHVAALALLGAAALAPHVAQAVGAYDGIYQNSQQSSNYLSVHQNGSTLIVASFNTISPVGATQTTVGGAYTPARQDIWDLYQGTITGSTGILNGQVIYGACQVSVSAAFDSTGVQLVLGALSTTASGLNQGMNCSLLPARTATNVRFNKVY